MQKIYITRFIKFGTFLSVIGIVFTIFIEIKGGCLAESGQPQNPDTSYVLRYVIHEKPYKIDAYIDHINLKTMTVEKSHSVNSDVNDISIVDNGRILLSVYGDGSRFFRQVYNYSTRFGWTKKIIETEGLAPKNVVAIDNKYFVLVDHGKKTPETIKQHPTLTKYQRASFEVFEADKKPKKISVLRLDAHDGIQDIAVDKLNHHIYAASVPFEIYDARFPEFGTIDNYLGYSYINVIDTLQNKVINRIDVSSYFKYISGIELIDNKLYVTALDDKDYDGDISGDYYNGLEYKKKYPEKKYQPRKSFNNKPQESLFVFSLNPFKLEKTIYIKTRAYKMEYDKQSNHLFIEHRPPMGSKNDALISVVDVEKGEAIYAFKIPGYKMMSLAAPGKLLVSSSEGLHVIDTKTLEIIKTIPGCYTAISERF